MRLTTLAAAAAGLLCLAGCQNTVNTAENTPAAMQPSAVDSNRYSTDSFCARRLLMLSARVGSTAQNLAVMQVEVRSERYGFWAEIWSWWTEENPYYISYKVDWFDEQGLQVTTAASAVWIPEIFYPGEIKAIQSVAPNSRCKDFRISFKETE